MRIFNLDVFNGFNRMNRHGWYISTIIAMYIIFALVYYLCSKLKTENKFVVAGVVLSVIAVGFRVWAHIADRGGMYTRELPTFAIGVMYATFYEQANKFLKKYFTPSVIICSIGFWVGFFTLEFIATYSAALFIITVSQKITYDSSVTYFLGKICLGVYLFLHFSSLALQPYVTNPYWWMLLNAGFILDLSVLLYGAQTLIQKFIQGCSTKIKERQENR
jgi:peptidoglycan/LPS O-acetylase OafA/YrhL